jgi:hypothetical protein
MDRNTIFGVALMTIGVVFLGFAYHATTVPMEKLSEAISGSYSTQTVWFFALGLAAVAGGSLLSLFGRQM